MFRSKALCWETVCEEKKFRKIYGIQTKQTKFEL